MTNLISFFYVLLPKGNEYDLIHVWQMSCEINDTFATVASIAVFTHKLKRLEQAYQDIV